MALIKFSTPSTLAGLFFCLASTRCRAFIFARRRISHAQAFTVAFLSSTPIYHHNAKTVYRALQGRFRLFALFQHTIHQPHKPPIYHTRHAGGHTVKRCICTDTRYNRHAGHCAAQHSRPIIIMYIRVQGCAPVIGPYQAVPHIADHASPAGLSSGRGAAARNHWRLAPHLFSGFRPIANRGQQ